MPIVNHTTSITINANGSQYAVIRYYDQDGTEYMQSFHAPAGADVDGIATARIPEMDEQLAQQEFETLVGAE